MNKYYLIYKPYGVVCQFSPTEAGPTLGTLFPFPKDVYPVGRLDKDSEGLLIITNDKLLHTNLLNPKNRHKRSYLVQVEGEPTGEKLDQLAKGVDIRIRKETYRSKNCDVELINDLRVKERNPPVRFRKNVPTYWIKMTLIEGKNRQIRKMTASVGLNTLRLIRSAIEELEINEMESGQCIELGQGFIYERLRLNV
ncbi:MAG: pseudouridine synthase [Bacteroidia bacterium]|nr:pseudouridine synthase [Bacteroidia bacterium]